MQIYLLNTPNTSSTTVEGQLLNMTSNTSASNKTVPQKAGKNFNEIFQNTTNKQNDLMKKVDPRKQQGQTQSQNNVQTDNKVSKNVQNNNNTQTTGSASQAVQSAQATSQNRTQSTQDTQGAQNVQDSSAALTSVLQDTTSSVMQTTAQNVSTDVTAEVSQNTTVAQDVSVHKEDKKDINDNKNVSPVQDSKEIIPTDSLTAQVISQMQKTADTAPVEDIQEAAEQIEGVIKTSDSNLLPQVKDVLNDIKTVLSEIAVSNATVSKDKLEVLGNLLKDITNIPEDSAAEDLEVILKNLKTALDSQDTTATSTDAIKPLETIVVGAASNIQTTENDPVKSNKNSTPRDTLIPLDSKQQSILSVDSKNISGQIEIDKTAKTVNVQKQIMEKEILDELNLSVDKLTVSTNSDVKSTPPSKTAVSASEQIVKMSIEKTDVKTSFETSQLNTLSSQDSKTAQNSSTPQAAQAPKELNKNDLLNQIGAKFEQIKNGVNSKITMTLRPIELGRVTIELSQNAKGVATTIIAQNQQVKEILEKNIDALRQQLSGSGINVQNINVKVAAETSANFSSEDFGGSDDASEESRENLGRDTSDDTRGQNDNNQSAEDNDTEQK